MTFKLEDLKQKLPYKWKIQSFNADKTKGSCVAYIDARDAMDMLDKVVGGENWKDEYRYENNQWLCGLSIKVNEEWVTKWDTGTAGDFEVEKSAISDSFKRAGVKWGIGRFLYDLEIKWVDCIPSGKTAYPVDKAGQRIWDLTKHFEKLVSEPQNTPKTASTPSFGVRHCHKHNVDVEVKPKKDGKGVYAMHMIDGNACFVNSEEEMEAFKEKQQDFANDNLF